MYKLAVRYDANGEIHLMISFRHGRHGFHGKRIKKICEIRVFRVIQCIIKKQIKRGGKSDNTKETK